MELMVNINELTCNQCIAVSYKSTTINVYAITVNESMNGQSLLDSGKKSVDR